MGTIWEGREIVYIRISLTSVKLKASEAMHSFKERIGTYVELCLQIYVPCTVTVPMPLPCGLEVMNSNSGSGLAVAWQV